MACTPWYDAAGSSFSVYLPWQVANELSSRTERVMLVSRSAAGEVVAKPIYREGAVEIESHIVQAVAAAHEQFCSK